MVRVCVVGAGSYVGMQTVALLAPEVDSIRSLDLAFRRKQCQENEERVMVDITRYNQLHAALQDVDVCVHVASYGMSGAEQLNKARVHAVNVQGTKNVIVACREQGVGALIYISTYNVVFNGVPFENGDEDELAYIPDDKHTDEYSRTKAQAEQLVLASNSKSLRTCALRPAAIYGDGEYRHLPRIIRVVNQGLGFLAMGKQSDLCDWVYGENLAHAIVLAVKQLHKEAHASSRAEKAPVAGHAVFISDHQPVNNFRFLASLLGDASLFSLFVPTPLMLALARVTECVHASIAPIMPFEPFLTIAEVCKVGITHYASPRKAQRLLGYTPPVSVEDAMQRTRDWCAPQLAPPWKRNLVATLFTAALAASVVTAAAVALGRSGRGYGGGSSGVMLVRLLTSRS